jgi:hypothetical protein
MIKAKGIILIGSVTVDDNGVIGNDNALVLIHFISNNPIYDKIYNFGAIGIYKLFI